MLKSGPRSRCSIEDGVCSVSRRGCQNEGTGAGASRFQELQIKREIAVRLRNRGSPLYGVFALASAGLERAGPGYKPGIIRITMVMTRAKMMIAIIIIML